MATTKHALPYPGDTDALRNGNEAIQALAEGLDSIIAIADKGILTARPTSTGGTPGKSGRFYYATDTAQLFFDHGTGWLQIWPASSFTALSVITAAIADGAVTPAKHGLAPSSRVSMPAGFGVTNGSSLTTLTWTDADHDDVDLWQSGNPSRLTVAEAGVYVVTACLQWTANGTGTRRAEIQMRDISASADRIVAEDERPVNGASNFSSQSVAGIYRAEAGDYFQVKAAQTSGGALVIVGDRTHFAAARIGA